MSDAHQVSGNRRRILLPIFLLAWVALAGFNVLALAAFGGWVGPADALIPWSVVASVLWYVTRRTFNGPRLRHSWFGKFILLTWCVLLALAIWGIDERVAPFDIWVLATVYLAVPFLASALVFWAYFARDHNGRKLVGAAT